MIKDSLKVLNPVGFLRAIALVNEEYTAEKKEPGASKWSVVEKYRDELKASVVAKWCELTGCEDWEFWWSTPAVCQHWELWRKSKYKIGDIDKYAIDAAERLLDATSAIEAIEDARDELNDLVENAMHRNGIKTTCSRG